MKELYIMTQIFSLVLIISIFLVLFYIFLRRSFKQLYYSKLDKAREKYHNLFKDFLAGAIPISDIKPPRNLLEKRAIESILTEFSRDDINKIFPFLKENGLILFYQRKLKSIFPLERIKAWSMIDLYIDKTNFKFFKSLLEAEKNKDVIVHAFLMISNHISRKEDLEWFLLLSSKYLRNNLISDKIISISFENILKNLEQDAKKYLLFYVVDLYKKNTINDTYFDSILSTFYFYVDKSLLLESVDYLLPLLKERQNFSISILKMFTKGDETLKRCPQELESCLWVESPLVQLYTLRVISSWKCKELLSEVFYFVFSKHWFLRSEAVKTLLSFDELSFPYIYQVLKSNDEYAKYSVGDELSKIYMLERKLDKIEKFKAHFPSEWQEIIEILDKLGYRSLKGV